MDVGQGKIRTAQFLIPINPLLPEVRITKKPGPPTGAKERTCIPIARIGIAAIGRAERPIEIPMRPKNNPSVAWFMKISAEHQSVDVATQDFNNMIVDPGIDIDVGGVAQKGIEPIGTGERTVKIVQVSLDVLLLRVALRQSYLALFRI